MRLRQTTRADAAAREDLRLSGLALFGLAAQFMTVIMLAASIAPGYEFGAAAISDLGAIPETALSSWRIRRPNRRPELSGFPGPSKNRPGFPRRISPVRATDARQGGPNR